MQYVEFVMIVYCSCGDRILWKLHDSPRFFGVAKPTCLRRTIGQGRTQSKI